MREPLYRSPKSTAALLSYGLLFLWMLTVGGVFALIAFRIPVADVMVGILGAILSTTSGALTAVVGYWLTSSTTMARTRTDLNLTQETPDDKQP